MESETTVLAAGQLSESRAALDAIRSHLAERQTLANIRGLWTEETAVIDVLKHVDTLQAAIDTAEANAAELIECRSMLVIPGEKTGDDNTTEASDSIEAAE